MIEESKAQLSPEQLVEQIFRLSEPNSTGLIRVNDWMTDYKNKIGQTGEYDFAIETLMPSSRAANLWAQSHLYQNKRTREAWLKRNLLAAKTRLDLASTQPTDLALHRFVERFFHTEQAEAAIRELAGRKVRTGKVDESIQLLARLDSRFQRFADSDFSLSFGTFLQNDNQTAAETAAQLILLTAIRDQAVSDSHVSWFANEFNDVTGTIGNKTGNLSVLLQSQLDALSVSWSISKDQSEESSSIKRFPEEKWTVRFRAPRQFNSKPVIIDDWLAWFNGHSIYVASLADGQPAFTSDVDSKRSFERPPAISNYAVWKSAYPVSRSGNDDSDSNLARLSASEVNGRPCLFATTRETQNQVVAVSLGKQGKLLPGFPIRSLNRQWQFDGVPIQHDGYLYVPARQKTATSGITKLFVNCYELKSIDDGTPLTMCWQSELVQANSQTAQPTGMTDVGLSLAGDQLLVNSNNGAIAALQIGDGSLDWLLTYRRLNWNHEYSDRGKWLAQRSGQKPHLHQNTVFVLPADSHLLLAIDRHTGIPFWKVPLPSITDLIHVSSQSVLLNGLGQLMWLDRSSGAIAGRHPKRFINTSPNLLDESGSMVPVTTVANTVDIWRGNFGAIHRMEREVSSRKNAKDFDRFEAKNGWHTKTNSTTWQDITWRRHILLEDDMMVSFTPKMIRCFKMKPVVNRSPLSNQKKETPQ